MKVGMYRIVAAVPKPATCMKLWYETYSPVWCCRGQQRDRIFSNQATVFFPYRRDLAPFTHHLHPLASMGKEDLKKIPDKLTDAEKKKIKNENKVRGGIRSHPWFQPEMKKRGGRFATISLHSPLPCTSLVLDESGSVAVARITCVCILFARACKQPRDIDVSVRSCICLCT